MTLPYQRRWAIASTRDFLFRLLNPKETPRVPRSVRREAHYRLKHFPDDFDMMDVATAFGSLQGEHPCGCLFTTDGKQTQVCDHHAEKCERDVPGGTSAPGASAPVVGGETTEVNSKRV